MQINGVSFVDANTGYATGYSGILLKTTNGGLNWTYIWLPNTMLDIHMIDATTGIVCGSGGNILKTTNGGVNWSPRYSNPPVSVDLNAISFLNASTGVIVGNSGTILKTTNAGNTWKKDTTTITSNTLYGVSYPSANRITAVGGSGTIITTINDGALWVQQVSGTISNLFSVYFRDQNNGCTVGEGGIILTTTDGGSVFVNQIGTEVPDKYSLSQNYPNPFNPTTKIKFSLPGGAPVNVVLKVYDFTGREVAVLVSETLRSGNYEVMFDGSKLSSGTYFYKLKAGDFTETKKLVLLK
jgi:photosystem II stability/assembly factor-like uncharacterized protein